MCGSLFDLVDVITSFWFFLSVSAYFSSCVGCSLQSVFQTQWHAQLKHDLAAERSPQISSQDLNAAPLCGVSSDELLAREKSDDRNAYVEN